jgi:aminopeptidase N
MFRTDTPRPIKLKDYAPAPYTIDRVNLDFSLHPTATRVTSRLSMQPNPKADRHKRTKPEALHLDGEKLKLVDIKLDNKTLGPDDYVLSESGLTIRDVPQRDFTLEIATEINPENNTALQGLYRSKGIYCTQCEAEGFRRITYFLDRPDVLATYRVRVEADPEQASVLLSNGNPLERGTVGKRHYAVWDDPHPKPAYLFALVGGNLASIASDFETASGRPVDLRIYVEPGKESRCGWAMDSLKRSMRWDEERFGREYDLDVFNIVAVSDFNMGAMENKGLNIFNDRLILASPDTATDTIYERIESVVAHEYFHNWTGNRITCRDWFQLCLKEGLTVFRDQEFTADERDATVGRINDVRMLKAHQFPEDAGPLAHPVRPDSYIEINNFYTATVYEKGAELVRMIQTICGEKGFRMGMDLYFARHDGEAATIEDFIKCFEEAARVDLSQFALWYHQAGTPELVAALTHNPRTKIAELTIEQVLAPTPGQARKKPMHIPVRMSLIDADGKEIALKLEDGTKLKDGVLHLTRRRHKVRFTGLPSRPVASLLRGFSAPVNLTMERSDEDLAFLMAHDTDRFNRWQAGFDYATRILLALSHDRRSEEALTRVDRFAAALSGSLGDNNLPAQYRAQLVSLPAESDIAQAMAHDVDPGAIHIANRAFSKRVGQALGDLLEAIYEDLGKVAAGGFRPDPASAGRRALRNGVLGLLVARGKREDKALLVAHFDNADNMTDQSYALHRLAEQGGAEAEAALAHFREQWQDDHIAIDTWFTAQATAARAATLPRVRQLMKDPLFSITTPNKVRALIGAFALANPSQFNKADGSGYRFLAQQVLSIDKLNPQLAARLLGAFRSWRTLKAGRREKARLALEKVTENRGISRDVYEIATKMIGDGETA